MLIQKNPSPFIYFFSILDVITTLYYIHEKTMSVCKIAYIANIYLYIYVLVAIDITCMMFIHVCIGSKLAGLVS